MLWDFIQIRKQSKLIFSGSSLVSNRKSWWWNPEALIPSSRNVVDSRRLVNVFMQALNGLGDVWTLLGSRKTRTVYYYRFDSA
jgi:hypothetical protein